LTTPPATALVEHDNSVQVLIAGALDRYAEHELSLDHTLEAIAEQLALVEQQLAPIAALRDQARIVLAQLMESGGITRAATTHAHFFLVPDTPTESYDAARLNSLIADLVGRGLADIAAEIVTTKKKGTRKGYLMVKPHKE